MPAPRRTAPPARAAAALEEAPSTVAVVLADDAMVVDGLGLVLPFPMPGRRAAPAGAGVVVALFKPLCGESEQEREGALLRLGGGLVLWCRCRSWPLPQAPPPRLLRSRAWARGFPPDVNLSRPSPFLDCCFSCRPCCCWCCSSSTRSSSSSAVRYPRVLRYADRVGTKRNIKKCGVNHAGKCRLSTKNNDQKWPSVIRGGGGRRQFHPLRI